MVEQFAAIHLVDLRGDRARRGSATVAIISIASSITGPARCTACSADRCPPRALLGSAATWPSRTHGHARARRREAGQLRVLGEDVSAVFDRDLTPVRRSRSTTTTTPPRNSRAISTTTGAATTTGCSFTPASIPTRFRVLVRTAPHRCPTNGCAARRSLGSVGTRLRRAKIQRRRTLATTAARAPATTASGETSASMEATRTHPPAAAT